MGVCSLGFKEQQLWECRRTTPGEVSEHSSPRFPSTRSTDSEGRQPSFTPVSG
ncbi:hypothetical protein JOB18_007884 [Solea senegalensis]|uniref:Uncharacterized protein n=1 Tax=Solea senegalensis TaxID=28829 RepID=A0AAV6RSC7_SOLSE|nr:hypothetical protein JOB18_007884 [Solea senegalensis]